MSALEHREVDLRTHPATQCEGEICCIHNQTSHAMRAFPQHWRWDRQMMERVCPHGVGHPDPDHIDFVRRTRGDEVADFESVHGCCGERCCTPEESHG